MKASANTETQVRALLWEEARVGGAIAAVSLIVSLLMLGLLFRGYGRAAWARDDFTTNFATLGIPLIVGFLIILNPDTSGHLVGGFSKRILRLPVQTAIAVAVSLFARTVIVFSVAGIIVGIADLIFDNAPGLAAVCLITLVYLAAQMIDWLRGPLRGLSSLVLIMGILVTVAWIWFGAPISKPLREFFDVAANAPAVLPAILIITAIAAYPVCSIAVRADRIGRRYGIPEIWEWPGLISPSRRTVNMKPFRSPMAAQVWFELRRSKFLLPLSVGVIFATFIAAYGIVDVRIGSSALFKATYLGPFGAVLLGAAVHGIYGRVIGFRRHARMTGYEYMQPFTDAQFATARITVSALLLVPTLIAALFLHFGIAGHRFVTDMIPEALNLGISSPREVAWILISRGVFVGLLAWTLLAIGTRMFRRILGFLVFLVLLLIFIDLVPASFYIFKLGRPQDVDRLTSGLLALFLTATLTSAIVLTRRGLLPRRTLAAWCIAWLLLAWLFWSALITMWAPNPAPLNQQLLAAFTALGTSALLPLVYFAILFDVHRRRSSTRAQVDPAQHTLNAAPLRLSAGLIAAAMVIVAVLWLGWPATPAYVEYRRTHGYPATLEELDAWYVTPSPGKNAATEYLSIISQRKVLSQNYNKRYNEIKNTILGPKRRWRYDPSSEAADSGQHVYIVGTGGPERTELMDRRIWIGTEYYWNQVTSKIVPQLQEIARKDTSTARYPADLRQGFNVQLEHLGELRMLAREASVDSLHWTISGNPSKATDSLLAGFAITRSLTNEPVIISQLVRIALNGMNVSALETMLNRSVPGEADLARLQRGIEESLQKSSDGLLLDRALIGEATIQASIVVPIVGIDMKMPNATLRALWPQLAYPAANSRMAFTLEMERTLSDAKLPWAEFDRAIDARQNDDYMQRLNFASPLAGILLPAMGRAYEAEWRERMELQNARVALAIERYRLANKKLPETLNALVPDFLSEVPEDHFAGPGVPLKYIVRENGEYAVYSIYRDQEDDFGVLDKKRGPRESDITFTVAPMSFRTAPQIAKN